jgi:hypothetical protein
MNDSRGLPIVVETIRFTLCSSIIYVRVLYLTTQNCIEKEGSSRSQTADKLNSNFERPKRGGNHLEKWIE